MVHNGYNEYSKQNLGNLKIGKYKCPNCKLNKEESKSSWINMVSEVKEFYGSFALDCLDLDVSYDGMARISKYMLSRGKDYFLDLAEDMLSEIDLPPIEFKDEIPIIHYDEQHPKRERTQKYRLTVLDGKSKRPIFEELTDSKDNPTIINFLSNLPTEDISPFIVTDLDRRYGGVFKTLFGDNYIHQKCLFHLNQLITKMFPKNRTIYQEYVKYQFLNIFYERGTELSFLEDSLQEKEVRLELGLPAQKDWKKEKFKEFRKLLHDMEKSRRRRKENLPMNSYDKSLDNLEELRKFVDEIDTNKINSNLWDKLDKRLKQIVADFKYLTAFHWVPNAPATNNAIENYYSTSLKTNHKKKLRTDEGIIQQLKISALKRAGMLGKPPITFPGLLAKFRAISAT